MDNRRFFTISSIVSSNRVLYTPSSFAKSSLLYLQEIGTLQALAPHTSLRSNLPSYLFFIVISGTGKLIYDGNEYNLKKGDMIFIDCRKSYSHTTDSDNLWTLQWCHFNGPEMGNIYNKYCGRGGRPVFNPDNITPFFSILSELTILAKSSDYMRDMKINALLSELLVLIMNESWHPENRQLPSKRASVLDVKNYLDENYSGKITLDNLCKQFYISKYYLTHSFKDEFGQSITRYLLSIRITHAKQLLRFSNKSIEEIGYEVGIGAPAYFSRVFKDVEGVSPRQYRDQW